MEKKINRNVKNAFTQLTAWTKEKWKKSSLSQDKFIQSLGLDQETFGSQEFSRFINGRYRHPPAELVSALARTFDTSEEELNGLHKRKLREELQPPNSKIIARIEELRREKESCLETVKKCDLLIEELTTLFKK